LRGGLLPTLHKPTVQLPQEGIMRFLPQFNEPSVDWSALVIFDKLALLDVGVAQLGLPIL